MPRADNCENCKHFDWFEECCWLGRDWFPYKDNNCPYCEYEVELTEDEKRANAGCDEAHRIMVEGREIE